MDTLLYGFSNHSVAVEGIIALPVVIGTPSTQANFMLDFVVVKVPSAYNAILGRPALNQLQAVVSTYHLKMKFSMKHGIGEVKGDQTTARQCYMNSCRSKNKEALIIEDLRENTKMQRGEPVEDLASIEVYLGEENKTVRIGSNLKEDTKFELVNLLRTYADIFAWTAADMPGIDPEVITHWLKVNPSKKPVKQKKRTFVPERQEKIEEEVKNLVGWTRSSNTCPQANYQVKDTRGGTFVSKLLDYFTKWTEAEPLATITSVKCEDFFWKNVVCRFGVPRALVVDNEKQFSNNNFRTFCTNLSIDLRFTYVAHPQSNGQTENINRIILQGLKKKLDEAKGAWVDELPKVLWAYRTTPHSVTGEMPFLLYYGTETMLPVEIGVPTIRALNFNEVNNEVGLRANLDLVEEARTQAHERSVVIKQRVARYYNQRV
ncbi:hypothetical protein RJ639_020818 [Escallonia herrerae]|uniref:Integrase catalytic domain-containing protein n=1 Tax=Escallonia herrerae TaxID=1293975 RepID=A0AA88V6X7_9ASTE|nr:hypothetical protein RJ639_020818 [Escallonia herrerae]